MGVIARIVSSLRRGLVQIVPPQLPKPELLVWLTGVLELAGALGLLYRPTRVWAALCLAALLVCQFRANVVAAKAPRGG